MARFEFTPPPQSVGQCTFDQSRALAELIARVIAHDLPEIATVVRTVGKREGRVYVDFGQNGHGRLLVSPYSVRPLPRAPVSTPLKWSEVTNKLDIHKFTMANVVKRLERMKKDPLDGLMTLRPDLHHALVLLAQRLED